MSLDSQRLTMLGSETIQEHSLPLARGNLRITWELHRPGYGNTISIQTGELGRASPDMGISCPRKLVVNVFPLLPHRELSGCRHILTVLSCQRPLSDCLFGHWLPTCTWRHLRAAQHAFR